MCAYADLAPSPQWDQKLAIVCLVWTLSKLIMGLLPLHCASKSHNLPDVLAAIYRIICYIHLHSHDI